MAGFRLKYVHEYVDCRGKVRRYFNRAGHRKIALPGLPGSREFREAYEEALEATRPAEPVKRIGKPAPGTLNALIVDYYASPYFIGLAPITKSTYRNEMERLRAAHGEKPVKLLDRKGVLKLIGERADRPGAANQLRKMLRLLMGFAIETGYRADDPTTRIRKMKPAKKGGFIAWSEEDVARFEDRHPVGSKARLALALIIFTSQRRSDIVRLGPSCLRGGMIHLRQSKTGKELAVPPHPELIAILNASKTGGLAFLETEFGKPFTPAGFGKWFGEKAREAGLPPGYNGHGLRKACLRRLAEAGCTTKEIMAISGHSNIEEVETYVREAEQKLLARAAMAKLHPRLANRSGKAAANPL